MMIPPPPPPPPGVPQDPHMLEANGRYRKHTEAPAVIIFLNLVNTMTQLCIGAVAFSAFSLSALLNRSALKTHIYLCVTGYIILMSQAILSFNSHAGWAYSLQHPHKKNIHALMQIIGSISAITGSVISIIDTESNFQTAHGITGLVAMVLTILSLIGGVLNFFFSAQSRGSLFRILHTCVGSLTISVAFVCLCLAFADLYRFVYGDINADISITLSIFAMTGILISVMQRVVKKIVYGD